MSDSRFDDILAANAHYAEHYTPANLEPRAAKRLAVLTCMDSRTRCAMTSGSEDDLHNAIAAGGGPDTRSLSFLTTEDQDASLCADVQRIRSSPYLGGMAVGGFVYDLDSGRLHQVC